MERGLRSLTGVKPTHVASSFADDLALASFTKKRKEVSVVQAITHTAKVMTKAEEAAENERVRDGKVGRISRKSRNRLLGIAFGCLLLDALISFIFCLLAPNDPRLDNVFASRQQLRTVSIQGIVAVLDALISAGVVVHVVAGILSASLDHFLEAAATKLLQAIFFSLLQTGYPTFMRLAFITVLLLLRVATAALILRAAFLSGVLNVRPSADLPKVIVSLLEMGAPVANTHLKRHMQEEAAFSTDRPLTFELMERLVRWLVPLRERAAAAGMGRRQVLLISAFIILMTGWMAFYEYWSILGDQGEFFVEGQLQTIEEQSFAYLAAAAYAVGQSARTVGEARSFLPYNVSADRHRVVAVVLSGLRYDAFEQSGDGDGAALARWRAGLDSSSSVLCKLQAEVPTLAIPNWVSACKCSPRRHPLPTGTDPRRPKLGQPADGRQGRDPRTAGQSRPSGSGECRSWPCDGLSCLPLFDGLSDPSRPSGSGVLVDLRGDAAVADARRLRGHALARRPPSICARAIRGGWLGVRVPVAIRGPRGH